MTPELPSAPGLQLFLLEAMPVETQSNADDVTEDVTAFIQLAGRTGSGRDRCAVSNRLDIRA